MLKADVIAHFGTQVAAARALGVTKSAVSQWNEIVPLRIALRAQAVSKGKLPINMTVYQLPEFPRAARPRRTAPAA